MSRKKIIIGNWKMNNGPKSGHNFVHELEHELHGKTVSCDFAIAAPYLTLPMMFPHAHAGHSVFLIPLAVQNIHQKEAGAFTGEISLPILTEFNDCFEVQAVKYVIIGHSERRQYFGETDQTVNEKVLATLKSEFTPVMAFGETLEEFEAKKTLTVIKKQLLDGLKGLVEKDFKKLILAYEPIWAIGTGKTATADQAQKVIKASREIIAKKFGAKAAKTVRIQYGGSVNPSNIKELMKQPDIDGALVGGASIKAEDFAKLITF